MTMKKGESSRFLFQPQYAYGDMGCPPLIPPAAMVLFEVQVLDYLDARQVDDFTAMSLVGNLQSNMKYRNRFSNCHVLDFHFNENSSLPFKLQNKQKIMFDYISAPRRLAFSFFSGGAGCRSSAHPSQSYCCTTWFWQPLLQAEPI